MAATAGLMGAAALAVETLDDLVLGTVRDVHDAVAGRAYRVGDAVAGGTTVTHRVHGLVARGVFGGLGHGLRGSARALRAADRAGCGPALEDSAHGRFVLSAVNGLIGDRLRDEVPEMSFDAAVRRGGRDVSLTPASLRDAFPQAGGAVVVFVHGLCETEDYWRRASRPRRADGTSLPSYGEALAAAHGWTPVHLRLNTGLPIQENGVAVAALLVRLVDAWPVPVRRLALVGHSMGGLVLRAACAVAVDPPAADGRPWTELVTDVVTLGTPHLGAPLERTVAAGAGLLGRLPEAAPFGRILEHRSVGILDLRRGLAPDVQHLPHARYHLVAGSLSASPRHPVALGVGDLLVQPRSAFGQPRRGPEMFPGADTLHVPGADHFDLLNHEDVHAALARWLADEGD
jgi:hypothetical protein